MLIRVISVAVKCQPNQGICGTGRELIRPLCYKFTQGKVRTQVDLTHCDQRDVERTKSAYKICEVPCPSVDWKPVESEVNEFGLNTLLDIPNKYFQIFIFRKHDLQLNFSEKVSASLRLFKY